MRCFHSNVRSLILLCAVAVTVPRQLAAANPAADDLAQGKVDEAIASLEKTISASPNDAASYTLLCRAYYAVENWDRAVTACEKAVSLEPNNSMYHLWLGRAYGEKADHSGVFSAMSLAKKVHTEFETAIKLDPHNLEARSDVSEFYVEAPGMVGGGIDKAEAQAQALEKVSPAKAHWIRGRIAEKKKDQATAEKEYRAAIQAHDSAETWLDLASFYRRNSRWDAMEDAINHAVSGKVDRPEVLVEAAETLLRAGRNLPKAAGLVRQYSNSGHLVEEAPAFKAHFVLGSILEKQGDEKGAAQEYSAALSLAREFSRAQKALDRVSH
jgi:tetratricopeptide (TPR) repeat protein